MLYRPKAVSKVLAPNDTGETGGHQAGILVPKSDDALLFFPDLGTSEKNPRTALVFVDDSGRTWKFNFIYYNNKFFDKNGTRNEYRLTGLTAFFREHGLKSGDTIILTHADDGIDRIGYSRAVSIEPTIVAREDGSTRKRLKLGSSWRVVDC